MPSWAVRISTGNCTLRPQAAQHPMPGQLGQAEVEDQQVEAWPEQGSVGFGAVGDMIDGVTGLERPAEPVSDDQIVFRPAGSAWFIHPKQRRKCLSKRGTVTVGLFSFTRSGGVHLRPGD